MHEHSTVNIQVSLHSEVNRGIIWRDKNIALPRAVLKNAPFPTNDVVVIVFSKQTKNYNRHALGNIPFLTISYMNNDAVFSPQKKIKSIQIAVF